MTEYTPFDQAQAFWAFDGGSRVRSEGEQQLRAKVSFGTAWGKHGRVMYVRLVDPMGTIKDQVGYVEVPV